MHQESPDQRPSPSPRRTFVIRWAICATVLWAACVGLYIQAEGLWSWGLFQGLVGLIFHTAEVMTTPAAAITHRLMGDAMYVDHTLIYYTFRFLLGACFWAIPLAACWQALDAARQRRAAAPHDAGRRDLLFRGGLAAAGTAVGGSTLWMTTVVPSRIRIRHYEVPIYNLPPALDGVCLAHITDTHHGPYVNESHIRRAIELANAEEPDLAVLTGDYVHRTPGAIGPGIGIFTELQTRYGVVAVLGNHDHWEGADACRQRFAELDIPLLENARLFLTPDGLTDHEDPDRSLAIIGVADMSEAYPAPRVASRRVSPLCPRVLLSHHPDVAERFSHRSDLLHFDLQLSGHTHGGQVSLPGVGALIVPSQYGSKYAGGLVQAPNWPVIVSRGVGMAVAPIRLGVPPEIGIVTLVKG